MSGGPRSLPSRPSLRYLKLEAKHRLATGEFPTLHDAQVAIAWEHGLPSWTALKQLISGQPQQESHALAQLRWLVARFETLASQAGRPQASTRCDSISVLTHFTVVSVGELIATITSDAADLREDVVVVGQAPLAVRARSPARSSSRCEGHPPHRLTGLQPVPLAGRVTDTASRHRHLSASSATCPQSVAAMADDVFAELGPAALVLAGGDLGIPAWVVAEGLGEPGPARGPGPAEALDPAEVLDPGHLLPALGPCRLVTATAVLWLIADGRFALDTPANDHLRTVRLADDGVTIRELLSHTGGIGSPGAAQLFDHSVPDLVTVAGPVVGCGGPRGVVRPATAGTPCSGS